MQWLFGKVKKIEFKKVKKLSNLKIKSEDFAQILEKLKILTLIKLDLFFKISREKIVIDSKKETIIGDLINHEIKIINNKKSKTKI